MTTLKNIQTSEALFKSEVFGWLVIIFMDLIVSWAFYIFLRPINRSYALLAGWLRLLYTTILAIAVSNLVVASNLARENQDLFGDASSVASQVMISITSFELIWSFGLIVFGGHLIVVGMVAWRSRKIPTIISIMLVVAGFSYMLVHVMHLIMPQDEGITSMLEMVLGIPMFVGELSFGVWLLIKGKLTAKD